MIGLPVYHLLNMHTHYTILKGSRHGSHAGWLGLMTKQCGYGMYCLVLNCIEVWDAERNCLSFLWYLKGAHAGGLWYCGYIETT